jgi:hypothetical protein
MRCMGNMCWCHYRPSRCSRCCRTSLGCGSADSGSAAEVAAAADSGYVVCEDDADDADDADGAHVDCGCGNRSRSKWTLYSGVDCCHRHNSQAHNWKYRQNHRRPRRLRPPALAAAAFAAAFAAALAAAALAAAFAAAFAATTIATAAAPARCRVPARAEPGAHLRGQRRGL